MEVGVELDLPANQLLNIQLELDNIDAIPRLEPTLHPRQVGYRGGPPRLKPQHIEILPTANQINCNVQLQFAAHGASQR